MNHPLARALAAIAIAGCNAASSAAPAPSTQTSSEAALAVLSASSPRDAPSASASSSNTAAVPSAASIVAPPKIAVRDPSTYENEAPRFLPDAPNCPVPKGMPTWRWGTLVKVDGLDVDAVVLTIDAGARVANLEKELDLLRERDVRATVFLYTGELSKRADGASVVKRILADGHELGNHTLSHKDMTKLSPDEIADEIDAVETFAQSSARATTQPFFRAPFLAVNDVVSKVLAAKCYRSVWITLDTSDDRPKATADEIVDAVFEDKGKPRALQRGSILLFHGSQPANLEALPRVIDGLRERGFSILRLSDALRLAHAPKAAKLK